MKRILSCLMAAGVVFGLAACGSNGETAPAEREEAVVSTEETTEPETAETQQTAGAPLILYFSRVGNTDFPADVDAVSSASILQTEDGVVGNAQQLAQWMAEETGGDLVELQTADKYPVDYRETTDQAKEEQNQNARPTLATDLAGLDGASTVYLVFPNWWADLPMALYTFFESYDLTGKDLYVSVTHGGSGFSRVISTIEALEPGTRVIEGLSIRDSDVPGAEDTVRQWVRETR